MDFLNLSVGWLVVGVSLVACWSAIAGLLPAATQRAARAWQSPSLLDAARGLACTIGLGVWALLFFALRLELIGLLAGLLRRVSLGMGVGDKAVWAAPLVQVLLWVGVTPFAVLALVGSSGLAERIRTGWRASGTDRPVPFGWAAASLFGVLSLPMVGWYVFAPTCFVLATGIGWWSLTGRAAAVGERAGTEAVAR